MHDGVLLESCTAVMVCTLVQSTIRVFINTAHNSANQIRITHTRSPVVTFCTWSPTETTTQAQSLPSTAGYTSTGLPNVWIFQSMGLRAATSTRMRTSSGPRPDVMGRGTDVSRCHAPHFVKSCRAARVDGRKGEYIGVARSERKKGKSKVW